MKKLAIGLASLALLFSTAGQAKELKIGVVDYAKIFQASPEVKTIQAGLKKQFAPRQEQFTARQKALQDQVTKLQRDGAVMTASQKTDLEQKVVKEKQELQRLSRDFQQDAALAENQAMQKFFEKVKARVDALAQKENYDLILQKNSLPFSSAALEITDKVLKDKE